MDSYPIQSLNLQPTGLLIRHFVPVSFERAILLNCFMFYTGSMHSQSSSFFLCWVCLWGFTILQGKLEKGNSWVISLPLSIPHYSNDRLTTCTFSSDMEHDTQKRSFLASTVLPGINEQKATESKKTWLLISNDFGEKSFKRGHGKIKK